MDFLKIKALEMGVAWFIGPLAMVTMQLLKRGVAAVDALPAWQKRATVVFLSAVFTVLGQALGVDFGVTPESLDGLAAISLETVKVALAAALAMGIHYLKGVMKKS